MKIFKKMAKYQLFYLMFVILLLITSASNVISGKSELTGSLIDLGLYLIVGFFVFLILGKLFK